MNMENFRPIKRMLEAQKSASEVKRENGDYYRVDNYSTHEYFDIHPEWRKKIITYFQKLHRKEKQVTYVDICGRVNGKDIGADQTYNFSLLTSESRKG
jgi:hypothetical protein